MIEREAEFAWDTGSTRYKVHGYVKSLSEQGNIAGLGGREVTIALCNADVEVSTIRQKEAPVTYKDDQVIVHCKSGQRYVYLGRCDAPYEDEALVPKRGHTLRAEHSRFLYYIGDEMLTHYRLPEPEVGQRYVSRQYGNSVSVLGVVNGYVIYGANGGTKCVLTVEEFRELYV